MVGWAHVTCMKHDHLAHCDIEKTTVSLWRPALVRLYLGIDKPFWTVLRCASDMISIVALNGLFAAMHSTISLHDL
jgi:hypothetical protein